MTGPTKNDIRRALLVGRGRLRPADRVDAAQALARAGLALARARRAADVSAFVSTADEPETSGLLDSLRGHGIRVWLPVIRDVAAGRMELAEFTGHKHLRAGPLGLLQPDGPPVPAAHLAELDLLLVPALAVDRRGTRLGRGGGFFDRALAGVRVPSYAVVYPFEVMADPLPCEAHDVAVSGALTPEGAMAF